MKFTFPTAPSKKNLCVVPVLKLKSALVPLQKLLDSLKKDEDFEGKVGQTLYYNGAEGRVIFVGLGSDSESEKNLTTSSVMTAFGAATKKAMCHRAGEISIVVSAPLVDHAQALAEAVALAAYQPSRDYKTGEAQKKLAGHKIEVCELVVQDSSASKKVHAAAQRGHLIALAQNDVRDWVNAPPNKANPEFFEARAHEVAKASGAKLTILREKEITKLGMGMLIGVNRGSPDEPRLVILDYSPKNLTATEKKLAPIVLVGKGIIFDSGGYNLKPRGHIEDMQLDKAGASTVIRMIGLLPHLDIKRRVIAVAPITENLIGGKALKPSEILTSYSGKTVEITNTDGEGRLILGDAIAYAIDQYKPAALIDIATLTGACMIALGNRYAGLFGNNEKLGASLRDAGHEVDEELWPLPIHPDFGEKMKGTYADLRNADLGSERDAGASKGAAFLQEFVGETHWAHLDIAGPAFTSDPKKYEAKGATGFGLRVLVRYLEKA